MDSKVPPIMKILLIMGDSRPLVGLEMLVVLAGGGSAGVRGARLRRVSGWAWCSPEAGQRAGVVMVQSGQPRRVRAWTSGPAAGGLT